MFFGFEGCGIASGVWLARRLWPRLRLLGFRSGCRSLCFTWRVGGVSKQLYYRVISTITPIRIPFRVPITLLTTYLVSPPTLQVGFRYGLGCRRHGTGLYQVGCSSSLRFGYRLALSRLLQLRRVEAPSRESFRNASNPRRLRGYAACP